MMNLLVVGAGYVGLITALGFAKLGNKVNVVDLNKDIINNLNDGIPTFYEPKLEDLLNNKELNINFFDNYEDAISDDLEFIFVCVQTPSNEIGQVDTLYMKNVLSTLQSFKQNFSICIKSTIQSNVVESICLEEGIDFTKIIFNPEFLREGSAIYDFFNPDRIVIGGTESLAIERCKLLYDDFECEIVLTDSISSQIIKYLSNTYLAMRLSYVNEAYRLISDLGGSPSDAIKGIGLDKRIGLNYFRPSPGWGGSCFPKDVNEIINTYSEKFEIPLIGEIVKSNDYQQIWIANKLLEVANDNDLKNIILIRAPFKENTDDLRDSPSIKVYEILNKKTNNIFIYEEEVVLPSNFRVINNIDEILENSLYVQMFPEKSDNRENLISKINNLENSMLWQMWEDA